MTTYLVQSFALWGEWETLSSHWSYRRARRVLCRRMSERWSARSWRIVRNNGTELARFHWESSLVPFMAGRRWVSHPDLPRYLDLSHDPERGYYIGGTRADPVYHPTAAGAIGAYLDAQAEKVSVARNGGAA